METMAVIFVSSIIAPSVATGIHYFLTRGDDNNDTGKINKGNNKKTK